MGRSCPYNCAYCGGGKTAYYNLCKRNQVILRDPKQIVEDIVHLKNLYPKLHSVNLTHGYYPGNHKYWMKLLQLLQEEYIDIGGVLEVWHLPVKDSFLNEVVKTFNVRKSFINFSVNTYSERVRTLLVKLGDTKLNFSNADLYHLIKKCGLYNLPLILWLAVGNPYESIKDVLINLKHILKISKGYILKNQQMIFFINTAILISPSSPAFSNEKKFGVNIKEKSFQDFYDLFRDLRYFKSFLDDPVNYETLYLSRRKIKFLNNVFLGINLISIILSLMNFISHKNVKSKNAKVQNKEN
jgi:radical SAM superfamily enzyme YgiQ (UPF0313 family)